MAHLSNAIANWQKRQAELQAQQVNTEKVVYLGYASSLLSTVLSFALTTYACRAFTALSASHESVLLYVAEAACQEKVQRCC